MRASQTWRVAVLPAGDEPLAVGRHRDLGDRAVPALRDERPARGRVPAVDRAGDRPDERRPVRREPQPDRLPVDLRAAPCRWRCRTAGWTSRPTRRASCRPGRTRPTGRWTRRGTGSSAAPCRWRRRTASPRAACRRRRRWPGSSRRARTRGTGCPACRTRSGAAPCRCPPPTGGRSTRPSRCRTRPPAMCLPSGEKAAANTTCRVRERPDHLALREVDQVERLPVAAATTTCLPSGENARRSVDAWTGSRRSTRAGRSPCRWPRRSR